MEDTIKETFLGASPDNFKNHGSPSQAFAENFDDVTSPGERLDELNQIPQDLCSDEESYFDASPDDSYSDEDFYSDEDSYSDDDSDDDDFYPDESYIVDAEAFTVNFFGEPENSFYKKVVQNISPTPPEDLAADLKTIVDRAFKRVMQSVVDNRMETNIVFRTAHVLENELKPDSDISYRCPSHEKTISASCDNFLEKLAVFLDKAVSDFPDAGWERNLKDAWTDTSRNIYFEENKESSH